MAGKPCMSQFNFYRRMFFIFISIICTVISAVLFSKNAGTVSLKKINMMSWIFWYNFVFQSVIGATLVALKIDNHYLLLNINDTTRINAYWAIMYTIIAFPIGMFVANSIFRTKNVRLLFESYIFKSVESEIKYSAYNIKMLIRLLSLLCILSVIYVLYVLNEIPLLKMIFEPDFDFLGFRIAASRSFAGNEYIKNLFAIFLTPIMSYIMYVYYCRSKNRIDRNWFLCMFIFSILIITYDFEKAPIVAYLLGFFFIRVYLKGTVSYRILMCFFIPMFVLLFFIYITIMHNSTFNIFELFSYNSGIVGRIVLTQIAGTFLSFDFFPSTINFIGFSSFSQYLSDILNIPYFDRAARLIMEQVNTEGVIMGRAGVVNSLFVAEAWANWGVIGLIISPIYVGFLVQSLYLFFLKSSKTPLFIGFFAYYSVKGSIMGGINDYFYNVSFIFGLFILILICTFSKALDKN